MDSLQPNTTSGLPTSTFIRYWYSLHRRRKGFRRQFLPIRQLQNWSLIERFLIVKWRHVTDPFIDSLMLVLKLVPVHTNEHQKRKSLAEENGDIAQGISNWFQRHMLLTLMQWSKTHSPSRESTPVTETVKCNNRGRA